MSKHEAILFVYEQQPERTDFYLIPANSGLNSILLSALRTVDGLMVNTTTLSPKTKQQWKSWNYVNAAILDNPEHLDEQNEFSQNRFYSQLVPFKLPEIGTPLGTLQIKGALTVIRSGMFL